MLGFKPAFSLTLIDLIFPRNWWERVIFLCTFWQTVELPEWIWVQKLSAVHRNMGSIIERSFWLHSSIIFFSEESCRYNADYTHTRKSKRKNPSIAGFLLLNISCVKLEGSTGMDWEFGIGRCKLLYLGWINNKVLLYNTDNYIQYPW